MRSLLRFTRLKRKKSAMQKRHQFIDHNLLTLAFRHGYKERQKMKGKKMDKALKDAEN
jgi:hypothetical protein